MAKVQITKWGWQCERCGHEWIPNREGDEPKVCPKCKSAYWNTLRKADQKQAEQKKNGKSK